MTEPKKRNFIVEVDGIDLAVRMCEASYQIKRPDGMTAREAFAAMDEDVRDGWRRAAETAAAIFRECIEKGSYEQ